MPGCCLGNVPSLEQSSVLCPSSEGRDPADQTAASAGNCNIGEIELDYVYFMISYVQALTQISLLC